MTYNQDQINELESIIAGIYYLSEESYRCGLDQIGLVLRAALAHIEEGIEEETNEKVSDTCSKNNLLELMDLLDLIKKLSLTSKMKTLKFLEAKGRNELH